jgi:hypothetical protein
VRFFSKSPPEGFLAVFCVFLGFSWALYDLLSVMRAGAGLRIFCGSLGWLLLMAQLLAKIAAS